MFKKFNNEARRLLSGAAQVAKQFGHDYIGAEHFLLAMVEGRSRAVEILKTLHASPERIRDKIELLVPERRAKTEPRMLTKEDFGEMLKWLLKRVKGKRPGEVITEGLKSAFQTTKEEAAGIGHEYIGTEHLLLGLLSCGDEVVVRALEEEGLDLDDVRERARGFSPE